MNSHGVLKYFFYNLLMGCLVITGCGTGTKTYQSEYENSIPEQESQENLSLDISNIIAEAEKHYEAGCQYYDEQRWTLARQEFDTALDTLLNADVDAETHYMLTQTYDRLFYKIHTLELKQRYLQDIPYEGMPEIAASTEELEASLSYMCPKFFEEEQVQQQESPENTNFFDYTAEEVLGDIVIDESDAEVMKYVKEFSRDRSQYRKGLERAVQYLPMIAEIFKSYQIPIELAFIPLLESNFRIDAVSPAGAVGLWQFVSGTAQLYGLKIDKWVDERRDPEKSTQAAAAYLKALYDMLGDWDLALAGYYMGEYKVHQAIGKHRTRDISALAATRAFGQGAKHYVSRMKAIMYLARNHQKFGVSFVHISPVRYETVHVKKGLSLKTLAQELGTTYKELCQLNPALKQGKTPPGSGTYALKVPQGIGSIVLAKVTSLEAEPEQPQPKPQSTKAADDDIFYVVKRGDNLSKIAKQYGVDANLLKEINNIRNVKNLRVGQKLRIPASGKEKTYASLRSAETITHTIQRGETLSMIAKRYQMDIAALKSLNKIKNERSLQIGQTLKVPLPSTSVLAKNQEDTSQNTKMLTYRVKRGDSLSKIASTFGVSVDQLQKWNNFQGTLIYPGSRIKVWY
ncbi:lytic transglycosylase catalytic [Candidatus Vecturithrix granuli]|uniref:Lytic transglycosylase catalytic n=1 Tax=Vecturithrix granuli TaxID=1499967 RepID=A0A0S6W6B7_VECG1|nr:lytic transglycosylase catalytic [Candidatus Vecturithrix granuli]